MKESAPPPVGTAVTLQDLRERLRHCADMARAMARLGVGRGGPRDLAALRDTLRIAAELRPLLRPADLAAPPPLVVALEEGLGEHHALVERLTRALAADLPAIPPNSMSW